MRHAVLRHPLENSTVFILTHPMEHGAPPSYYTVAPEQRSHEGPPVNGVPPSYAQYSYEASQPAAPVGPTAGPAFQTGPMNLHQGYVQSSMNRNNGVTEYTHGISHLGYNHGPPGPQSSGPVSAVSSYGTEENVAISEFAMQHHDIPRDAIIFCKYGGYHDMRNDSEEAICCCFSKIPIQKCSKCHRVFKPEKAQEFRTMMNQISR